MKALHTSCRSGLQRLPISICLLVGVLLLGAVGASTATAGPRIAFTVRDSTAFTDGIWTVAADGSGLKQLTSGPAYDLAPAWSPGRGSIAFIRSESGNVYDRKAWIMVMRADGSKQRRLAYTGPSMTSGTDALAYSPNGRYLAGGTCLKTDAGWGYYWGITVLDLKTRVSHVVYRYRCENGIRSLAWSADSRQLVATVEYGGGFGMFRVDVPGNRLLQDYNGTINMPWASWRADGRYLLVTTYPVADPGAALAIQRMRPDGRGVKTVAKGQGLPVYAPTGDHYAFSRGGAICYADGDGSHVRTVLSLSDGRYPSYLAWR